ncbi:MAG TPA: 16S rRNA (cytidine(1402)-2'-O)-methyltransferase [Planctomycetota bacterium]|jgi:16S rRNA (cytidine1402-2'-O)-methyltransferase|nr:16S rRNA (cytidine(1402)-2'-O)-methyltransferase [Planctomycetota bacterium]
MLYVLATPIGNLEDLSARALRILREADAVVSEDTRTTLKLLQRYEIQKPLIAYFQHSPPRRLEEILEKLQAGRTLALVTESGTPGVSDPGARLVDAAFAAGVKVVPIPGASAVASAAAVCGFGADSFHFAGFLPRKPGKRRKALEAIGTLEVTLIVFESPYRVADTLEDMHTVLGDRRITICRELTKIHEEVWRTTLSRALERYRKEEPRGEFTLAVEGRPASHPDLEAEEPG